MLGQLQYSRHAEVEADRDGMKLLLAGRISPDGMIGFFEDLSTGEHPPRVLRYLSSHPSSGDRMAALRELAAQAPGDVLPPPWKRPG